MRTYSILVVLTTTLIMGACKDSGSVVLQEPQWSIVNEDHSSGYTFPAEGSYYEYRFSSYDQHAPNIQDTLRTLYVHGIVVLDAWYQSGSNMCRAPGSNVGTWVIVPPRFIIRLKAENRSLEGGTFEPTAHALRVFCGYSVKRYSLIRPS